MEPALVRLDAEHRSKGIRLPLERCFFVRVRNFRRFSFWANSTPEKSHLVLNSGAFGFADYSNGRHLPPPSRQFPQLAVCEELVAFYSDLSHNLDEGLNCLHFHRLKQEELCILLRGYYSLEDLYILLKSVIGSSDNFKDFVLENYQHVNDVSDFALLAHMSVRNFQRKFKEEFKWPVREWLNERRAERILRDIRNTDKSIAEIATSYGFATASYFTVFCKQYFGMTPSELRRRSKQTATKCRE